MAYLRMTLDAFFSSFVFVFLSELGDKTMLTTLCLSAQSRRPWGVLTASMLALGTATIIGAIVGLFLSAVLPLSLIILLSAFLFIVLGITTLRSNDEPLVCKTEFPFSFINIFTLVLFSELGDKSQIVVLALASTSLYPVMIVFGALFGFLLVNSFGVFVGHHLAEHLPVHIIRFVTGILFVLFGLLTLLAVF